jgi:hypothetical protein
MKQDDLLRILLSDGSTTRFGVSRCEEVLREVARSADGPPRESPQYTDVLRARVTELEVENVILKAQLRTSTRPPPPSKSLTFSLPHESQTERQLQRLRDTLAAETSRRQSVEEALAMVSARPLAMRSSRATQTDIGPERAATVQAEEAAHRFLLFAQAEMCFAQLQIDHVATLHKTMLREAALPTSPKRPPGLPRDATSAAVDVLRNWRRPVPLFL